MREKAWSFVIFSIALLLTGCGGEFNKVYKSDDLDYRYEYAKQSFAEGKYNRAADLLLDLITEKCLQCLLQKVRCGVIHTRALPVVLIDRKRNGISLFECSGFNDTGMTDS